MKKIFVKLLEEYLDKEDFVVLAGDLGFGIFDEFRKKNPNNFINIGISEQNIIGIAAGMAKIGKKVFVYSITPFITFRCLEQIRNDVCYHNLNVTIIGTGTGFNYGSAGFSHHATDDIGIMKSLPNLSIYSPLNESELGVAIKDSFELNSPFYIRLGRNCDIIEIEKYSKNIYKYFSGNNTAIITYGDIIYEIIDACKKLEKQNINISVYSIFKIKQLPKEIENILNKYKNIIIIEEHNKINSLGSSIFTKYLNNKFNNYLHIALNDEYISVAGDSKYLRIKCEINSESIVEKIIEFFNKGD